MKIHKNSIHEAIEHINNSFDKSNGYFELGRSLCPISKIEKEAVVWIEENKTKLIIIIIN